MAADVVDEILAALASGAGAGVSGTATESVNNGFGVPKALIRRKFAGRDDARAALKAEETEPGVWQATIGADLAESGAAADEHIVAAARELLALAGAVAGRDPRVDASHAQGVQVGHHNTQTNTFN
ncbi:hypothetical protein ACFQS1_39115 [Paractinoplanes rhizophilus]|uniref:Uncharacterized protein n=1 Tax=Paractinoplanes rhizophilus TaxID=1416877 RepID=A0ABW2I579_9ACTN